MASVSTTFSSPTSLKISRPPVIDYSDVLEHNAIVPGQTARRLAKKGTGGLKTGQKKGSSW